MSLRILRFLNRRKKNSRHFATNIGRHKGTQLFVKVIFSFIIPYFFVFLFSGFKTMFKPNFSYTTVFLMTYLVSLVWSANSAISPTLMFYDTPELRRMLREFTNQYLNFRKCFQRNVILDVSVVEKQSNVQSTSKTMYNKVPGRKDDAQQNSHPNSTQQLQELMLERLDGGDVADVKFRKSESFVIENSLKDLAKLDLKKDVVELNDRNRTTIQIKITKF
jgi:uncharacterized membrane protein YqaE (UPF0057 family)